MRVLALWAGIEEADYDETLEASFSEHADGSGLYIAFQRDLYADDPYEGPDDENDRVNNTYCLTTSDRTWYGGLQSITFAGNVVLFRFDSTLAEVLKLDTELEVVFQIEPEEFKKFKAVLQRIVTWGAASQVPNITGL